MARWLLLVLVLPLWLAGTSCTTCEDLKEEARALRDGAAFCEAGDTCTIVSMYDMAGANNCLGAFQCGHALNADTDLDSFSKKAKAIADDFNDGCNECTMAGCVDSTTLTAFCDLDTHTCAVDDTTR